MLSVVPDNDPLPPATVRVTALQVPTGPGGQVMACMVNSFDLVTVAPGPVPLKQKSPMVSSAPFAVMCVDAVAELVCPLTARVAGPLQRPTKADASTAPPPPSLPPHAATSIRANVAKLVNPYDLVFGTNAPLSLTSESANTRDAPSTRYARHSCASGKSRSRAQSSVAAVGEPTKILLFIHDGEKEALLFRRRPRRAARRDEEPQLPDPQVAPAGG